MDWSYDALTALRTWAGPGTALTADPSDIARFYAFVAQVWNDTGRIWDESEARRLIGTTVKELHSDWNGDGIDEVAERREREGTLILDFLCAVEENRLLGLLTRGG